MEGKRTATKNEIESYLNDIKKQTEEEYADYLNLMKDTDKYTPESAAEEVDSYSKKELQYFRILVNCCQIFEIRGYEKPKLQHSPGSNLYKFISEDLQVIYHKTSNLTQEMVTPGIKNILFVQEKDFKESIQKIDGHNLTYIYRDQMIPPIKKKQIRSYVILDSFDIYKNLQMDFKYPIILHNDPLVLQLGMKVGQVLKIETILPESTKLPQIEYNYRIVSYPQTKSKAVYDDEQLEAEAEFEMDIMQGNVGAEMED